MINNILFLQFTIMYTQIVEAQKSFKDHYDLTSIPKHFKDDIRMQMENSSFFQNSPNTLGFL